MGVQGLLSMCSGHVTSASRNLVKLHPESFDNLSVELSRTSNEAWSEAGETFVLVAMHMEQSNTPKELHVLWDREKVAVLTPLQEMKPEVAIHIVIVTHPLALLAGAESLGEAIIHVHMSRVNHQIYAGTWLAW